MTTHDDANPEPSEVREPALDELLGDVLGLIDQVVTARLADGELARRRARIKAKVDRGPLPPPASGCDALATPHLTDLPGVPTSGSEWPQGLQVYLAAHRRLIAAAERDAEKIRHAARQAADEYHDAAIKRAAETVAAARQEAERIRASAQQEAERIRASAQQEAEQLLAGAEADRKTLATLREVAGLLDSFASKQPARRGQQAEVVGKAQPARSRREVLLGLVPDLPLVAPALNNLGLLGVGGVGSMLANLGMATMGTVVAAVMGHGVVPGIAAFRDAFAPGPAVRRHRVWAEATDLRLPKVPSGDAGVDLFHSCIARTVLPDRWSHFPDPAGHPKGRIAGTHIRQSGRAFPVAPASLRDYLVMSADLERLDLAVEEDCLVWCEEGVSVVMQAKHYSDRSDVDFDKLPVPSGAAKYVVFFVSNCSLTDDAMLHVSPSASADLPRGWRPVNDLTLGSR